MQERLAGMYQGPWKNEVGKARFKTPGLATPTEGRNREGETETGLGSGSKAQETSGRDSECHISPATDLAVGRCEVVWPALGPPREQAALREPVSCPPPS